MRILTFTKRCIREILRDPLNIGFGLGFPLALLLLLSAIQANIPVDLFEINNLTPGIAIFSLSFITLFSATLVAKDRESALLQRLYTSSLAAREFILGYTLAVLPIALLQTAFCYLAAIPLGLTISANILFAIVGALPMALFNISLGLLCGSILNVKQVGGLCGALLTNLSAWLSGVWFDLKLVGGVFEKIAGLLPFLHAVELERALVLGDFSASLPHLLTVLLYAAVVSVLAVIVFLRQMKNG